MPQKFFRFGKNQNFYKFLKLGFFIIRPSEAETGSSDVISGNWRLFWSGVRDRNTSGQDSPEFLLTTYLGPSLLMEHRPSTTLPQRTLFWAVLAAPVKLVPCFFSSASVSRLQLLRGRPLFLFPCGFQFRAWRVMLDAGFLRVCSIHTHFLFKFAWPLVLVPLAPTEK